MMIYLIALLCFALRQWPRLIVGEPTASDTHFHLSFAKNITENGGKVPFSFHQAIFENKVDYPFFYHWFLSRFRLTQRKIIEKITSPIADTLLLLLIPTIASQLVPDISHDKLLLILLIFAVYPALFRGSSGPRVFSGCPRVLGQFIYLLHLTLFINYTQTNNVWSLAACIVLGAILANTSKFGLQVTVFFSPFIVWSQPIYFLIMLASGSLAALIWRKHIVTVIKGHIIHAIFYCKFFQQDFQWPMRISAIKYIRRGLWYLKNSFKEKSLRPVLSYIYGVRHPLNTLIFIFPIHVLAVSMNWELLTSNIWGLFILGSMACFALTSLKWLSFLGESERYLEYSLIPSLILCALHIPNTILLILAIPCLLISLWLGYEYVQKNKQRSKDLIELKDQLGLINSNELIWPIGSFQHTATYLSGAKVLTFGGSFNEKVMLNEYKLLYSKAPYPSENWGEILKRYSPGWILSDKDHLDHYYNQIIKPETRDEFTSLFKISYEGKSGLTLLKKV